MQSNQCVVCFPTPCCLNREIEIVSPEIGYQMYYSASGHRSVGCFLVFCLFIVTHIPCLIYFLSVSIPLRTGFSTTPPIHLCVHFKCTGCLAEMLCTCLWERCAFRDIQWQTTLNQPWFLYRNAWSQEDYKSPGCLQLPMEISTLFLEPSITCLPLNTA